MNTPKVVKGNLGWRNPDGPEYDCNQTQFRAYGPGGRWAGPGGDAIENALVEAGASGGDRLIVIALDRYARDQLVAYITEDIVALLQGFDWETP
jgi:hypothetical protein